MGLNNRQLIQIALVAAGVFFLIALIGLVTTWQLAQSNQFGGSLYFYGLVMVPRLFILLVIGGGIAGLSRMKDDGRSNQAVRILRVYSLLFFIVIPLRLYGQVGLFDFLLSDRMYWIAAQALVALACQAVLFLCLYQLFVQNEANDSHLLPEKTYDRIPNWRRLVHLFCDGIGVVILLNLVISGVREYAVLLSSNTLFVGLAFGCGYLIYYLLCESVFHQTLGKALTDTRVCFHPTASPVFWAVLKRTLSRFVPFEWLSIFGEAGMWHDEWSATEVLAYHEGIGAPSIRRINDDLLDTDVF